MTLSADMSDFTRRDLEFRGRTKPVFVSGQGPAVLLFPEIFGITPTLLRLARWLRDGGFSLYVPALVGTPDASNAETISPARVAALCISREFSLFAAGRASPVTLWLRDLAHRAHDECGGSGVGVLGLCLTGGFALAMAVDPVVQAPVLGEPSLPALRAGGIDASPADLATVRARCEAEGMRVRGYRFETDTLCRAPRFAHLREALGTSFLYRELPEAAANPAGFLAQGKKPHSVFTVDLVDAPDSPTRQAVDEVIAFFRERLIAPPA